MTGWQQLLQDDCVFADHENEQEKVDNLISNFGSENLKKNLHTILHKKLKELHRQINLGYVVDAEGMACRACSADFLGKIQWSCCLICQWQ